MQALMSVMALYHWDNTIFETFQTPEKIDKEILIESILYDLAELSIIYNKPDMFKAMLGIWSKRNLPIWEKLLETTEYEYNPIHNYDRTEESEDNDTVSRQYKDTGSNKTTSESSNQSNMSDNNVETLDLKKENTETRYLKNEVNGSHHVDEECDLNTNKDLTSTRTDNLAHSQNETIETSDDSSEKTTTIGTTTTTGSSTTNGSRDVTDDFNSKVTGTNQQDQKLAAFNSTELKNRQQVNDTGDTTTTSKDVIKETTFSETKDSSEVEVDNTVNATEHREGDTTIHREGTDTGTVNTVETVKSEDKTTRSADGTHSETGAETGTISNVGSETGTVSNAGSADVQDVSNTESNSSSDKEGTSTDTGKHTSKLRAYGNIGVTTTQQMIEAQREVVKFNIYDYIVEQFKLKFCVLVY